MNRPSKYQIQEQKTDEVFKSSFEELQKKLSEYRAGMSEKLKEQLSFSIESECNSQRLNSMAKVSNPETKKKVSQTT